MHMIPRVTYPVCLMGMNILYLNNRHCYRYNYQSSKVRCNERITSRATQQYIVLQYIAIYCVIKSIAIYCIVVLKYCNYCIVDVKY